MSKKHNVKHRRGPSLYPERLAARGESSATVRMPFFDRGGRRYNTIDDATRANQRAGE